MPPVNEKLPSHGGLLAKLAEGLRPDQVDIGARVAYTPGEEDDTGTWAELAEQNDRVRYLLRNWVPYAMLTGIVGEPKAGKSAFVLWALVRPVITGKPWFTGQLGCEPGYVVWCDTERRAAVNLERAKKWGLPVERILMPFKDRRQVVNIDDPEHMKRLLEVVCSKKARLVVVDSYRGAHTRDENNSTIAVGLQALAGVCEETEAACAVIHHAKKMLVGEDLTINCGRGSNAFLAAVACQVAIDIPDPKQPWRRVQVLGENLGIAPKPRGFRISDSGLEFGEAPKRPAKETKETGKDRAEDWLRVRMKPGVTYPASEVIAEAEALGFSHTGTLQRAKAALEVSTEKCGKFHFWRRPLPDDSYVYALTDGLSVKVGRSDQDPAARLKDLQTGNPRRLRLLGWTTTLSEGQVKGRLAREHERGEWFKPSPAVLAEIGRWEWRDEAELAALKEGITRGSGNT